MRVIVTGGGTGGHIYPALAIADKIKEKNPDAEILFVGTERGLEKMLVPEYGYPIEFVTVKGFDRRNPFKNLDVPFKFLKGKQDAARIMKSFKPDVVVATGGYVCLPVVRAANAYGAKTYIHEQNAFPGITNKLLEGDAEKVFLGFGAASAHFKHKEKHILTGNPVRKGFFKANKYDARKELGFDDNDFVILSFGGSQGAGRINKAMMGVVEHFNGDRKVRICMATGRRYYDAVLGELREHNVVPQDNIRIMEYIDEMNKYLAAADLLVSRSGALSVAEATVCGTPAIFIPLPTATENHQYHNACSIADEGGAIVINESDLTDEKLIGEIEKLEKDRWKLAEMSDCSKACAYEDAAEIIYSNLSLPEEQDQ